VFRRQPFGDVIRRQLELFQREEAELVRDTEEAERAYTRAPREEAEAYYEKYADLVETGTEALADLRDTYSRRLDEDTAEEYEAAFNRAVKKRLPQFGLEIRDT
jgi:C-terminal processing protease CtpA/Prc